MPLGLGVDVRVELSLAARVKVVRHRSSVPVAMEEARLLHTCRSRAVSRALRLRNAINIRYDWVGNCSESLTATGEAAGSMYSGRLCASIEAHVVCGCSLFLAPEAHKRHTKIPRRPGNEAQMRLHPRSSSLDRTDFQQRSTTALKVWDGQVRSTMEDHRHLLKTIV